MPELNTADYFPVKWLHCLLPVNISRPQRIQAIAAYARQERTRVNAAVVDYLDACYDEYLTFIRCGIDSSCDPKGVLDCWLRRPQGREMLMTMQYCIESHTCQAMRRTLTAHSGCLLWRIRGHERFVELPALEEQLLTTATTDLRLHLLSRLIWAALFYEPLDVVIRAGWLFNLFAFLRAEDLRDRDTLAVALGEADAVLGSFQCICRVLAWIRLGCALHQIDHQSKTRHRGFDMNLAPYKTALAPELKAIAESRLQAVEVDRTRLAAVPGGPAKPQRSLAVRPRDRKRVLVPQEPRPTEPADKTELSWSSLMAMDWDDKPSRVSRPALKPELKPAPRKLPSRSSPLSRVLRRTAVSSGDDGPDAAAAAGRAMKPKQ